jgi:hypothetical protein
MTMVTNGGAQDSGSLPHNNNAATTTTLDNSSNPPLAGGAGESASAGKQKKGETSAARKQNAIVEKIQAKDTIVLADVVLQVADLPEVPITKNGADTTRLVSVCGVAIADMSLKSLEKFCVKAAIGGYSRKTKKDLANLIVAWRLNNAALPGLSTGNTAAAAAVRQHSSAPPDTAGPRKSTNYARLINCLFHPTIRPLYAKFKQQPDKATLDAGKKHNQLLCQKVLELYNSPDRFPESDSDDNVGEGEDHNIAIQLKFHKQIKTGEIKPSPFNKLENWGQVLKSIQTLHKHFTEVQTVWKRSGEHRGAGDVITGMGQDILKDCTFTVANMKVLYYILFLEKDPQIFASAIAFLPDGAVFDSGAPRANSGRRRGSAASDDNKGPIPRGGGGGKSKEMAMLASAVSGFAESYATRTSQKNGAASSRRIRDMTSQLRNLGDSLETAEKNVFSCKDRYRKIKQQNGTGLTQDSVATTLEEAKAKLQKAQVKRDDLIVRIEQLDGKVKQLEINIFIDDDEDDEEDTKPAAKEKGDFTASLPKKRRRTSSSGAGSSND